MSDYGLQIKNSSGGIQIDSTYRNYSLWSHGSGLYDAGAGSPLTFTATSGVPIFAWRPITNNYSSLDSWIKSGSNYTGIRIYGAETYAMSWAVFTEQPANSLPGYGMVIRNASNVVVFSSDEMYFKIRGVYAVAFTPTSHQDITVIDAANNYFFLTPTMAIGYAQNGLHIYLASLLKLSGTSIRVAYALPGGTTTAESDSNIDNINFPAYAGTLIEVEL